VSKNPQDIITHLEKHHSFALEGTGPTAFHLGCDYTRQPDGVLCFAPEKYIQKMIKTYVDLFGQQPKQHTSPLLPIVRYASSAVISEHAKDRAHG